MGSFQNQDVGCLNAEPVETLRLCTSLYVSRALVMRSARFLSISVGYRELLCCSSIASPHCDVHLCVAYENSIFLFEKYKKTPRCRAKSH